MSVTHMRRNSSPHVTVLNRSTPPRKTSQPERANGCKQCDHSPRQDSSEEERDEAPVALADVVIERLADQADNLSSLLASICEEAKKALHAETCTLFMVDRVQRELFANLNDNGKQVRLPMDKGVVGRVVTTHRLVNVKHVDRCTFFYPNVDEITGFHTRNILCVPIIDKHGSLIAAIELCNKVNKAHFSRHDELWANTFAVHCANRISHCIIYGSTCKAHTRSHMASEYVVQGSQLLISPDEVNRLATSPIRPTEAYHPQFSTFSFVPRCIGDSPIYMEASISIFHELGFISLYRISRRTLAAFVLRVARGYRDVPYHNWSHAFAVAHFCFLLLRCPSVRSQLSELERLSLLVACLCHDIDHRGTTNAFQEKSKTPLAQLYSSEGSVLERHHLAQTLAILSQDEFNILSTLTRTQHQAVLNHLGEIILATDIAAHLGKVPRMREMIENGMDRNSADQHYLFTCLLMTSSDLSDQTKHFQNSKAIAENIYTEFFSQGDLEKQMGNPPAEMMDRDRACVPQIQINFIDCVALPVFDMLSDVVPDSLPSFQSLIRNRRCWLALDAIFRERRLPLNDLEYLHDKQLEDAVLERAHSDNRESLEWKVLNESKWPSS